MSMTFIINGLEADVKALTAERDEAVALLRRWWHWHPSDIPLGNETQELLARLAPPAEKPERKEKS